MTSAFGNRCDSFHTVPATGHHLRHAIHLDSKAVNLTADLLDRQGC